MTDYEVLNTPRLYVVGADEVRITFPLCRRDSRRGGVPEGTAETSPEEKRSDSVGRALRMVYDCVKCNEWQFFVTQTVNGEWCARSDLDGIVRILSRGVADQNKRAAHRTEKIRYIWVPELHADGRTWHLHGVMSGLRPGRDLRRNANGFFEWAWSADRVGFFSCSAIRSRERCASYVRKYVVKNVRAGGARPGAHLYYRSRGLLTPDAYTLRSGALSVPGIDTWLREAGAYEIVGEWYKTVTLQGTEKVSAFREAWGREWVALCRQSTLSGQ